MEEKEMTIREAFTDFIQWAFHPDRYHTFTVDNRHYFRKTAGDIESGHCGVRRVENIFKEHAKGRYKLNEATFTKNDAE
jgi:hypothetical protein